MREYKDKYPNLAVLSPGNEEAPLVPLIAGAAESLGGGTQAADAWVRKELGPVLMTMSPQDLVVTGSGGPAWCLGDDKLEHLLFYSPYGPAMVLYVDLPAAGYTATWVNPLTGETQPMTFQAAARGRRRWWRRHRRRVAEGLQRHDGSKPRSSISRMPMHGFCT